MIKTNDLTPKLEIRDKVFQPDFAQPNMTMHEHGENEYRLMIEKQERQKASKEMEDAYLATLTQDEIDEMERKKTSAWDDWKDENEKGAGNKQR